MSGDSETVATPVPDTVQLTIRCAFQTVEDQTIAASSSWTVKQLKEQIKDIHPSHPNASTMKLIYGGHCLHDERTLKSIFEQVPPVVDGPTVFHLVGPLPRTEPQLRHRNTAANRAGLQNLSQLPSYQQIPPNWANYSPAAAPNLSTGQGYIEYYRNYINYCRIQQQMIAGQLHGTVPSPFPHAVYVNNGMGAPMMPYFVNPGQNQPVNLTAGNNQPIVVNAVLQQPANPQQPAAPPVPDRGVGGLVEDGLDLFYKGIRVLFILSAVLLYSTLERFLLVIGIVLVILFTQYRRAENRRAAANAQPVNNNNAGEQQQENRRAALNEEEGAEESENEQIAAPLVQPVHPVNFQTVLGAVYSFVTSFITSLVPDHHIPVDMN